jgi:excinuclease UvrABC nuclease subunit
MPKTSGSRLVKRHLEKASRKLLEDESYRKIIKDLVSSASGIYALYHDKRLKYVGLASDLPRRLAQHLHDRHSETWNTFSIYLTVKDTHMKELESLILRIT